MSEPRHLTEHFFRHQYGRLIAVLVRQVGTRHLEVVEDAVQVALMTALETWPSAGVPNNPNAWLFLVARNSLLGELRQRSHREQLLGQNVADLVPIAPDEPRLDGDEHDDLLRLFFVCCDEAIPRESQVVLALKILSGFTVREIAIRLLTSEANVYKRLHRARSRLRERPRHLEKLTPEQYASRVAGVREILYLLFTEGYLSSHDEMAIRRELCDEAIRLTGILANHALGDGAETSALMALMHFHSARLAARRDAAGGLLLLEEQDRDRWDQAEIEVGFQWLAKSAVGGRFSRYHAEAAIAAEHCLATSFKETRWAKVAEYYAMLEHVAPSALHRLNYALAVAEDRGPVDGLAIVEAVQPPTWLEGSYMWMAVLADLHRRCGHAAVANRYTELAVQLAPSAALKLVLQRRLGQPQ